ncbi:MAG: hypothetical protein EHM42_11310 [Planctomycetaceae bacterium]|nr:MAG: hypothetical protein EHM42_11310 [Planctomycetaceae bacterium]
MAKITRLSGEQRENLVAYLDGELDETSGKEIEQVLGVSPVARHDVDMLSRTWDLLSVLPEVSAPEDFTEKTLGSIRLAEQPRFEIDGAAMGRTFRRGVALALATTAVVAAGVAGYTATSRWVPNEADELVDDYEIISELDKYQTAGSEEFLKLLQQHREFTEHEEPPAP